MNSQEHRYKSTAAAKYILARANAANIAMNMTKLQKLLYAAYGIYLALEDRRLTDEHPKAWPYGPVFPAARERMLRLNFGKYDISSDAECAEISSDAEMADLITFVLRIFGAMNAGQLTLWSHEEGTPWDITTRMPSFKWNSVIPDGLIKDYFLKNLIKNEQ